MIDHPYLIANWKMQLSHAEARQLMQGLRTALHDYAGPVRLIICPSFTALPLAQEVMQGSKIKLGAQDVFWAERGAYTGEISPLELQELGVSFVIVGHSERRQLQSETDEMVARKMMSALSHGLQPILCVGETADQRRANEHEHTVRHQLEQAFRSMPPPTQGQRVAIAYEPIWAIGTGQSAAPDQAAEMKEIIRQTLVDLYGSGLVDRQFRVLYGGSVNPDNLGAYVQPDKFQGVLASTASLEVDSFVSMVNAMTTVWQ